MILFLYFVYLYLRNLLKINNYFLEDNLLIQINVKDHNIDHEYLHIYLNLVLVLIVLVD